MVEYRIIKIGGATFDREKAVRYAGRLSVLRLEYARAISAGKKVGEPCGDLGYFRDRVNSIRRELKGLIASPASPRQYIVRNWGGLEISSEVIESRADSLKEIQNKVRRARARLREIEDRLALKKPNHALNSWYKTLLKRPKYPKDTAADYLGLELECIVPEKTDFTVLYPFAKWIDIVGDGSIEHDSGDKGAEIRVCIKREELKTVIPPLVDALQKLGARVNKSCGFHVHIDQRNNEEPALAFQKLVRSLKLLYTVVPKSRRANRYCLKNTRSSFDSARHGSRYKAINACAYNRHKTLEVRLFGGTLDAGKIINWVETLLAIVEGGIVLRCPASFDAARKHWKLSDENIRWLKARQDRFSSLNALAPNAESETENINENLLETVTA